MESIKHLAAQYGLMLGNELSINDQGLDFQVAIARDLSEQEWVLRIPRREGLWEKIQYEQKVLSVVSRQLSVKVPDWQIIHHDLIAYPLITDPTAMSFDPKTYDVTWHIDQKSSVYIETFARLLVELHATKASEADARGIRRLSPEASRAKLLTDLELVKTELGISEEKETRWRRWIDNDKLWPNFSVLVHGDLYAGHVTAKPDGTITGVIDWSEAEFSDSTIDFTGHLAAFDRQSLEALIKTYERFGRTWPTMKEQVEERFSASAIKFGVFALTTQNELHLAGARAQLKSPT